MNAGGSALNASSTLNISSSAPGGFYQFTPIDGATRYSVLKIYDHNSIKSSPCGPDKARTLQKAPILSREMPEWTQPQSTVTPCVTRQFHSTRSHLPAWPLESLGFLEFLVP